MFKDKVDVKWTPSYLEECTVWSVVFLSTYADSIRDLDLVNLIILHIVALKLISHLFDHSSRLVKSFWSSSQSAVDFICLYRMASSDEESDGGFNCVWHIIDVD